MQEALRTYMDLFKDTTACLKKQMNMKSRYREIVHKTVIAVPMELLPRELAAEIGLILSEDATMQEETNNFLNDVISKLESVNFTNN